MRLSIHNEPAYKGAKLMRTAIGYTRLSVDKENSISIEYQTKAIKALAKAHNLKLVGIEVDMVSGKSIKNRPGIQRLIQAVELGHVQSVLTFKSDRLTRQGNESLRLEALFQAKGILYITSSEGILNDPTNSNLFDDPLMKYIRAGLAERERSIHSYRLKKALTEKRERNERLGSQPRYGYMVINGELVENPKEVPLINRIRQLSSAGHSTRNIASIITNEGFQTRKGTDFGHRQVHLILTAA